MNYDAVMRSFTEDELVALVRYNQTLIDRNYLLSEQDDPAAYAARVKWLDLGGREALKRAKAGTDPTVPTTLDELLEHFNDVEIDLVQGAYRALRDQHPMTDQETEQYGRWLTLGGALVALPHSKADEEARIQRHVSTQLLALAQQRGSTI